MDDRREELASELGRATFLIRAFVDGDVTPYVKRQAAEWLARHEDQECRTTR